MNRINNIYIYNTNSMMISHVNVMCYLDRWDYVQSGSKVSKDMDRLEAYYKGMTTWGRWVDLNVNPSKTKVFFQGISPSHYQ